MREEKRPVIVKIPPYSAALPDTPYTLWESGELWDLLNIPNDGTHLEIIDGEIVVSPPPLFDHNLIVQDISDCLALRRSRDRAYPWRCIQNTGLNFVSAGNGYIPDLLILDAETREGCRGVGTRYLLPDQIELVVEVTSSSNARNDRPPLKQKRGKWVGYARAEVPYYLLVDDDPKVAATTLYSIPDQGAAAYLHQETWKFGETIMLPDPFDFEIPTDTWQPWS